MKDKLRFIAILLCTQFFIGNSLAQNISKQFYISAFGSLQKVDDRLVGLTDRDIERFRIMNEEKSNNYTKQIGFEMGIDIFGNNYFSITGGLNYSYEKNSYIRLFYWQTLLPKDETHVKLPRYLDVYSYHLAGSNIRVSYELINSKNYLLKVGFSIIPVVRFLSYFREALVTHQERTWNKVDYFSTEFNPIVGLLYGDVELDVYYRLFQIKKVDRAIFNKYNTGYGAIKNDYEIYNPLKFGISIKYWFNLFQKKSNEKRMSE